MVGAVIGYPVCWRTVGMGSLHRRAYIWIDWICAWMLEDCELLLETRDIWKFHHGKCLQILSIWLDDLESTLVSPKQRNRKLRLQ